MSVLITGHEADIGAIEHENAAWEKDVKAQLRHIIAIAQDQLDGLDLAEDVFGEPFADGENKVSLRALESIVACVDRIRNENKKNE